MLKPPKLTLPANRQGILIDACSILLNLFLWPVFTGRVGNLFNQSFGNNAAAFKTLSVLMLLILAGRLGGLYLKRFPLQARLPGSAAARFPFYFAILSFPLLVVTSAFAAMLLEAAGAELGLLEKTEGGAVKTSMALSVVTPLVMVFLCCLESYLLYRLSKPLKNKAAGQQNWRFSWKGELLADFGLFAYMMVWQVFHHQTVEMMLTPAPNTPETLNLKIGGVFFSFFSFLIFYLSPRAVFLIEDWRYLVTWLSILLVFLSSLARYW